MINYLGSLTRGTVIVCSIDHLTFAGEPIMKGSKFVIQEDLNPANLMTKVNSTFSGEPFLFTDHDLNKFFDLTGTLVKSLTKPVSTLLSDKLMLGEIYRHKTNGESYVFKYIDINDMYYFETISTKAESMFGKDWVDMYLEPEITTSTVLPASAPILKPGYAFTNANYGSLTKRQGYTSLGEVSIVDPKIIHNTCRTCHQAGSHNVVNHKEYYYCRKCKCEC